ncbi:acyl carrier protein [Algihabitans albus]|uniref:acyl carrier protein n=1 Tax=Algihabitans albus TaxID=2164067 RepID=UPI000E5CB148|nr:acyl carrier protein [Algihabitans albus]
MVEADHQATFESIRNILEVYNAEGIEITTSTRLMSDLNIDSVAAMDLIMEIEDRFEIDIPVNMVSDVETTQDLVRIVVARLENRA